MLPHKLPFVATVGLVLALTLAGCHRRSGGRLPPSPPPLDKFEVVLEIPAQAGKPAPTPPEAALAPYRIWVNQEVPMQKKTPVWRSYPSEEGALLDLPKDGAWRCLVTPAHVFGKIGENAKIDDWETTRYLRCSSDGWHTYSEAVVKVALETDGKIERMDGPGALYLKDVVQGKPRTTAVVLDRAGIKGPAAVP